MDKKNISDALKESLSEALSFEEKDMHEMVIKKIKLIIDLIEFDLEKEAEDKNVEKTQWKKDLDMAPGSTCLKTGVSEQILSRSSSPEVKKLDEPKKIRFSWLGITYEIEDCFFGRRYDNCFFKQGYQRYDNSVTAYEVIQEFCRSVLDKSSTFNFESFVKCSPEIL